MTTPKDIIDRFIQEATSGEAVIMTPGFPQELDLGLNDMQKERDRVFAMIREADLDFLKPRLCKEGYKEEELDTLIAEYKRYLMMREVEFEHLPMYSVPIDAVWHAHILHTRSYMEFCVRIFGEYLHHGPYSKTEFAERLPDYYETTLNMYEELFGETAPPCWHIIE